MSSSSATRACPKCGELPRCQVYTAVCETRAMKGYKAPCAIKWRRRQVDIDDAERSPLAELKPAA